MKKILLAFLIPAISWAGEVQLNQITNSNALHGLPAGANSYPVSNYAGLQAVTNMWCGDHAYEKDNGQEWIYQCPSGLQTPGYGTGAWAPFLINSSALATNTFTPTPSYTPTSTFTGTWTPNLTLTPTPSYTSTPSYTPTVTTTPRLFWQEGGSAVTVTSFGAIAGIANTNTPTATPTPTGTPTPTFTPNATTTTNPVTALGTLSQSIHAWNSVSVKEYPYNAVGNGIHVDTTAFNNAFAYLLSLNGGTLIVPSGTYLIDGSGIGYTNNTYCVNVEGAGSSSTTLIYSGTGNAFAPSCGVTTTYLFGMKISGITLLDQTPQNSSFGINLTGIADFEMDDVEIYNFKTGLQLHDSLTGTISNCIFNTNNIGVGGQIVYYADPNALTFSNCHFVQDLTVGAYFQNPANVNFYGGSFEECGLNSPGPSPIGVTCGLAILNNSSTGLDGAVAGSCYGTYFEGNYISDAYIYTGDISGYSSFSFNGCNFNRISGTSGQYATNDILVYSDTNSSSFMNLIVKGCGFQGFNTYTPDSGRPYIKLSLNGGPVFYSDGGSSNIYGSSLEIPSITNSAAQTTNGPNLINGSVTSTGACSASIYGFGPTPTIGASGNVTVDAGIAATPIVLHFNVGGYTGHTP